ncbi:restriction endonuclease subunit S [Alteromonas macleodii]|uniref:restriction endonuclease subunit S n=1 Tax=Alteromonas macleodii TaxID=28108 RepID=UPI002981A781|nr:restriction endonuclease subunit S [Alteromonas macleodii]MDW5287023.1 restriction endonuclease subunit S [Alteromonas macleodii]
MSKYFPYNEYKQTEVDWLGVIPVHWDSVKLKFYCKVTDGSHHSPKIESSGYPFISVSDVGMNSIDFENAKRISEIDYRRLVSEGCKPVSDDLLLTKDGTIGRACIVTDDMEDFVILSSLGLLSPSDKFSNRYLYYYLISNINVDQMNSMIHGSALRRMTINKIDQLIICLPSVVEQDQIANFLDHETAKIDTLIEKQQQLINLLKEKRQAVISHAVTKGLNPEVPMKDSGLEWLGGVPAHWDVVKLSYKMKLLSGDSITSENIESQGEYRVYGGNGVRGYTNRYNCNGEYVLIGRQGALCGNINIASGKFFATEHAVVVYPYEGFDTTFLSEFLRFMDLGQYSVSAAQPGISVDRINSLKIAVPPQNEQIEIGKTLQNVASKFEALSSKANKQITLLSERRAALISAAVTGKIDVRNWKSNDIKSAEEVEVTV